MRAEERVDHLGTTELVHFGADDNSFAALAALHAAFARPALLAGEMASVTAFVQAVAQVLRLTVRLHERAGHVVMRHLGH